MSTAKEYDHLISFVETRANYFEKATNSVKQSLETVNINKQWQARNYESIGRILTDFSSE